MLTEFPMKWLSFVYLAAHLQEVLLQGVGLSSATLSKLATDYVSALVDNAMVLGVRDTSLGRYTTVVLLSVFYLIYCLNCQVIFLYLFINCVTKHGFVVLQFHASGQQPHQ